jgi:hypothetical protein
VMGQLPAPGALDDRFLKSAHRRLELFGRDRPLLNKLIQSPMAPAPRGASGGRLLRSPGITPPHVMPHTQNFGHSRHDPNVPNDPNDPNDSNDPNDPNDPNDSNVLCLRKAPAR